MPSDERIKDGDFTAFAIIFLVLFIVTAVTYSAYLFIDLTHVPNIVGIHVTKNLAMAANRAQGKLYSNQEKSIKDWIVYTDRSNGFRLKYPSNLTLQKESASGHYLVLRQNSASLDEKSDSLSSLIYIDIKNNSDSMSIKDQISGLGLVWKEEWQQNFFAKRPGIRTGEQKAQNGITKDVLVWQFGGKIFVLGEDCFKEDSQEAGKLFDKIISEFEFI